MGLSNIEDILQAGLDGETLPTPESRIAELLKEWIEQGGNIDDILVAGSNITLTKNSDGTITIAASGEVSSEDTVARADIAAIKDGTTIDSFGDVETALGDKADTTDIPTVPITAIQKNGTGITPVSGTVNITVPTSAADVSALPVTTKYAASLSLTINPTTFVMTGQLKDQNGDNLGAAQTIDLPLESVVVDGSYDSQTKKVVLTLQNGNTIEFSIADLVSGLQTELSANNKLNPAYINYDSTHRAVSDTEKSTWNDKQNAIDGSHKLSADHVDDTDAINKFATAAELEQIEANKNNILSFLLDGSGKRGDLNDIAVNEFAVYYNDSLNLPSADYCFVRTSVNSANPLTSRLQEVFVMSTGVSYVRTMGGGTWHSWLQITNTP